MDKEKSYSYEDVLEHTKKYFKGDELASTVWISKYALKDSFGNIFERSPEDMHHRIADEIVRIEKKYPNPMTKKEVMELISDFKYIIPQGGPMTGIGNNIQIASLSNCFVIGHQKAADSYGGIIRIDEEQVQLMKRRGGVGHDLSHLRPSGTAVLNSALTSTGIVPFMERYSNSTREVAQDGRRGALMLSLSIKHPDAEAFIDAKMTPGKVTGANVSVKIDDEFMRAALRDTEYNQQFPIDSKNPSVTRSLNANGLWKKIIRNAWKSAEPGVLFWDTIIRESIPDCYADLGFKTVSTNPCGEIPLCPYDSCRLIAINLYSYVKHPFTKKAAFDMELFRDHVQKAMRMMDDIIDMEVEKIDRILEKINADPEDDEIRRVERELWEKIRVKALAGRRTGLGITAEGDMLAALGMRYGSDDSIAFAVEVQKNLALAAYRSSVTMAKERGSFPMYSADREVDNPMINRIKEADPELYADMTKHGRRNIAILTIAPTGSTSIMSQTTSGVEPVFKPFYKRRRKVNPNDKDAKVTFVNDIGDAYEEHIVFHHKFVTWAEINGHSAEELKAMSIEQVEELAKESPYYKATADDIDWVSKVRLQGAIQKWVDHSISVTVNLPNSATEELVAKVYQTAWESGCKGITVYRDGCREGVLVSAKEEDKAKAADAIFSSGMKRPAELEADVVRFTNGKESWIAFVGLYNNRPYEIFTGKIEEDALLIPKYVKHGKLIKVKEADGTKRYDFKYIDNYGYPNFIGGISRMFNEEFWNYAKLISGVLRNGMPIVQVVTLVSSLHFDSDFINTWKNGVARALSRYVPTGTKVKKQCSECGEESIVFQEGCLVCTSCGHSKCP